MSDLSSSLSTGALLGSRYSQVYFIGIGGIGMSALARYCAFLGAAVSGYDLTPSPLIDALQEEGIEVTFSEAVEDIPMKRFSPASTLVVYTPAVPATHKQLVFFREQDFKVVKRAEALGLATASQEALCVAGTHGKTTTSSMLTHLLSHGAEAPTCSAFLGGISTNYHSNFLFSNRSNLVVVEADEYDRSFWQLHPKRAIITSVEPDHLDIYGTPEQYRAAFEQFASQIKPGGDLVVKEGLPLHLTLQEGVTCYSYGMQEDSDFQYHNIRVANGTLLFDWYHKRENLWLRDLSLGVPVRINVENATAALAVAYLSGASAADLRAAIASFAGTKRRFQTVLKTDKHVLIDDYAHHPAEIAAAILSVRELYQGQKVLGIFQPHLYSRTADFHALFAESLSKLESVILLDIYPAREEPIPGITSKVIYDEITSQEKYLVRKEELLDLLQDIEIPPVVLMMGAGNIDRLVQPVAQFLATQ